MPRAKKTVFKESKTLVTDCTDGMPKIVESEHSYTYAVESEPAFVKFYLKDILYFQSVPEATLPVLLALMKRIPYADDDPYISITKRVKTSIAEKTNLSYRSVERAITNLVKGHVLIKDTSSPRSANYKFNPYMVARGDWKDIKHIQLIFGYSVEGKDFITEVNNSKSFEQRKKIFEQAKSIQTSETEIKPMSKESVIAWKKTAIGILKTQLEKSEIETQNLKTQLSEIEKDLSEIENNA